MDAPSTHDVGAHQSVDGHQARGRHVRLGRPCNLAVRKLPMTTEASRDPERLRHSVLLQSILDEVLLSGMVYGPLRSKYDASRHCLVAQANWKEGVREPYSELLAKWGSVERWPPAAACSTLVGLALGSYLNARHAYKPAWGRSITSALKSDPFLAPMTMWHARGRRQFYWDDVATKTSIAHVLTVALYRGHVSLVIDADAVDIRDPRSDMPVSGCWVLSADGGFRDTVRTRLGRKLIRRLYCGRPVVFESAAERAKRDRRPFALVGIMPPRVWPSEKNLIVLGSGAPDRILS